MSAVDELLKQPPFGLDPKAKAAVLLPAVQEELVHHQQHCGPFARWCSKQGFDAQKGIGDLAQLPFLPVNIFKRLRLSSVAEERLVRELTSSATSSQIPSRVVLDQTTRGRQVRSLTAILSHCIGGARRPFVVLDAPPGQSAASDRKLSARAAGMRGYLLAASETHYAFQADGAAPAADLSRLLQVLDELQARRVPFCLLGYTPVLYQQVVRPLYERGIRLQLPPSVFVLHFGGWKRLQDQAVTKELLTSRAAEVFGLPPHAVCDIYGFTEQLGVIYPDGPDGWKRTPAWSEVFVRDPRTLELVPDGEPGLLEFVCPLPHSYPGIAVLLDDVGRIMSRGPGPDGSQGTAFEVIGRAAGAEIRGCGDTLPPHVYRGGKRTA